MIKLRLRRFGAFALVAACSACTGPGRDNAPVPVIGVILPFTGDESVRSAEVLSGMRLRRLRAKDIPLEILQADGNGEPLASARRLAEMAADEQVVAVVGGWHASVARPLASLARARGVSFLALSPLAAPRGAAAPGQALHRLESLSIAAASWARDDQQFSLVGLVRDSRSESSRRASDAFSDEFVTRGGRVAWTVDRGEDGRVQRPDGPETAVDLVFLGGPARLAQEVAAFGPGASNASYVTLQGWEAPGEEVGDLTRYHVTCFVASEDRPAVVAFRGACEAAGVQPTEARALGWDAVSAVLRLGADATLTRRGVAQAMRTGGAIAGVTGRLAIRGGVETPAIVRVDADGREFLGRVAATDSPTP